MRFEIAFSGHKNIRSTHKKTIEITKEPNLTPAGDCIIGVNASYGCKDLPESLKEKIKNPNSEIKFSIKVNDQEFTLKGQGNEKLTLNHAEDIVIRKSTFVSPRTLAVACDKASDQLPRDMVKLLQNPETKGTFTIIID